MSKGGSKPSKPKMSIQEKTQLAASKAEWDHYKKQYQPIERDYLRDSSVDHSARASAEADTGVMREGTESLRLAALGGGSSSVAGALGAARSEARNAAIAAERQERDQRMAGALGIGRELATDSQRSLSGLARAGSQTAVAKMQNKLKVDSARSEARASMLGSLAGAGASMYLSSGGQSGSQATSTQNQHEWAPPPVVRR